jgi:alpha-tubulin suppressor-like RCC1 family protein
LFIVLEYGRFVDVELPEMSCGRTFHSSVLWDDGVYLFGGNGVNNEVEVFDLEDEEWYIISPEGPAPSGRYGHAYAGGGT